MKYDFSSGDLFDNPHRYMYPGFYGYDFLLAWKKNREDALIAIAGKCDHSSRYFEVINRLCYLWKSSDHVQFKAIMNGLSCGDIDQNTWNQSWPDTEKILMILAEYPQASFEKKHRSVLKSLVRRFEISKKLPTTLVPPGMSLNDDPILFASSYALLAEILALRISISGSAAELNCLLKINDLLISQDISWLSMSTMTTHHYSAMAIGIMGELVAVEQTFLETPHDFS
jgi:hypothetical protein